MRLVEAKSYQSLWSSVASAQDAAASPAARADARDHFRLGVELFQEQAYRAALVEFQRAYDRAPEYRLLYNIGQAKLAVQDYLGAAQSYERYLTEGGASIPAERRTQVEEALTALRERVGRISVAVNREHAEVFVDEERVGESPLPSTILANVGRHRVSARTPDGASDARNVDVAGGDIAEVSLSLALAKAPTVVPSDTGDLPWSPQRKAALVGWSAGGALLIGSLVTGVMTLRAQNDLDELLRTPEVRQGSVKDKRDDLHVLAVTTDILIATGAAAAVTGTLLWLLHKPKERKAGDGDSPALTNMHLDVGLASLRVRGQF